MQFNFKLIQLAALLVRGTEAYRRSHNEDEGGKRLAQGEVMNVAANTSDQWLLSWMFSSATVSCSEGMFLAVSNQPELGLFHVPILKKGQFSFAKLSLGEDLDDCPITLTLSCDDDKVVLHKKAPQGCSTGVDSLQGGPVGQGWQICKDQVGELRLQTQVLSQVWDNKMGPGSLVDGCIQLLSPAEYPELSSMRGTLEEQRKALKARKQLVGGCPLFRSAEDRSARGHDFPELAWWLPKVQSTQAMRAEIWKGNTGWFSYLYDMVDSAKNVAGDVFELAFFGGAVGGNRTTAFNSLALMNCGEAAPFIAGPQVFRHADVARVAGDLKQPRQYYTATVPQMESCFHKTGPLFQSSGSKEHTQLRQLLDEAGFDRMHLQDLPAISAPVPSKAKGHPVPTEMEVGRLVLPRVMEGLWQKRPTASTVEKILPYLDSGKLCIFGQRAATLQLLSSSKQKKIRKIRQEMAAFARHSPRAEAFGTLINSTEYHDLKYDYETRGAKPSTWSALNPFTKSESKSALDELIENVADGSLFAGLLGTTDMATKCVSYQWQDPSHVRMYRKDKTAYLHELMRYDGAVTSFTSASKATELWKLEGHDVKLPKDTPVQMVLGSANRDGAVFKNPEVFDPTRSDIGQQVSWNGKLKDVMARDYAKAPRFCPGYFLSIKVATLVCDHFTQDLSPWGTESQDEGLLGLVEVTKGPRRGQKGVVSYFDFKANKHCLIGRKLGNHVTVDTVHSGGAVVDLGCYPSSDLRELDRMGGFVRTIEDEAKSCPAVTGAVVSLLARSEINKYQSGDQTLGGFLLGKDPNTEVMDPDWADSYAVAFYGATLHLFVRKYSTRYADDVVIPTKTGKAPTFSVGAVAVPSLDIDTLNLDNSFAQWLEKKGVLPNSNCIQNGLRGLDFEDMLDDEEVNTWEVALKGGKYKRKKDWILSFYAPYTMESGEPAYPVPELDFAQLFLKGDMWDDLLEKTMAFELIGAHRVKQVAKEWQGETFPFALQLNDLSAIETRPLFGRFGADMFFTAEGMPAIIVTPEGKVIERGSKDWHYWKFVWRSTLLTGITLTDHLHMTHFKAANTLAKATRRSLSPDHPLRRFLSVFTFGSISVNLGAIHSLAGPNHALHRSTPFKNFEELSEIVPKELPDVTVAHRAFLSEEAWDALPPILQAAPYFADGKLLFQALQGLIGGYLDLFRKEWCAGDDTLVGKEMVKFRDEVAAEVQRGTYQGTTRNDTSCEELKVRMAAVIWTVTGWHRHVGTVADYYSDPDLATFSWKEGEAFPRPKHHMILSAIASFTGTTQPKLMQDYTHVFQGMYKEAEAVALWQKFREELRSVKETIQQRNSQRPVKNYHADPDIVECSVAV